MFDNIEPNEPVKTPSLFGSLAHPDTIDEPVQAPETAEETQETVSEEEVAPASVTNPVTDSVTSGEPSETPSDSPKVIGANLKDMTLDELKNLENEAHEAVVAKQQEEKKGVIEQVINVVKEYSITPEELVEALGGLKVKRKGVKAKIKYRDDAGNTWSGRGKEPNWIKGKDRESFRVRETEVAQAA